MDIVDLARLLRGDPLWRKIPRGNGLLTDVTTDRHIVFEPHTFQVRYDGFGTTPLSRDKFAAGIIVLDNQVAVDNIPPAIGSVISRAGST